MLLQMTLFHSFLWLNIFPLCVCVCVFVCVYQIFTQSSVDGHIGFFPCLGYYSAARTLGLCIFVNYSPLQIYAYEIPESYGNSIFNFLKYFHTTLHNGCTNLHSHKEWNRIPFSPLCLQHLLFADFLMMVILTSERIPVELFQFLTNDAVKELHSICQQIWKTQQWPQDWKRSVFIPLPKKGNAKECSNYHTIALISHTVKVMIKILQANLDLEKTEEPVIKLPTSVESLKKQESSRKTSILLYWLCQNLWLCG